MVSPRGKGGEVEGGTANTARRRYVYGWSSAIFLCCCLLFVSYISHCYRTSNSRSLPVSFAPVNLSALQTAPQPPPPSPLRTPLPLSRASVLLFFPPLSIQLPTRPYCWRFRCRHSKYVRGCLLHRELLLPRAFNFSG